MDDLYQMALSKLLSGKVIWAANYKAKNETIRLGYWTHDSGVPAPYIIKTSRENNCSAVTVEVRHVDDWAGFFPVHHMVNVVARLIRDMSTLLS